MKITVFWIVVPCSLVESDQSYRDVNVSIIREKAIEAVSTYKTLDYFYESTHCNMPEKLFTVFKHFT
jgi:hypothetical protein